MIDKVENYCTFWRGKEKDGRYKNNNGSKWNQSDSNKKLWDGIICKRISYAVCIKKENKIVGHLPLGKSGKFAK